MNANIREHINIHDEVMIVQKNNQKSGKLTQGIVKSILTNSPRHPHGIKVKLECGLIGRVKQIL